MKKLILAFSCLCLLSGSLNAQTENKTDGTQQKKEASREKVDKKNNSKDPKQEENKEPADSSDKPQKKEELKKLKENQEANLERKGTIDSTMRTVWLQIAINLDISNRNTTELVEIIPFEGGISYYITHRLKLAGYLGIGFMNSRYASASKSNNNYSQIGVGGFFLPLEAILSFALTNHPNPKKNTEYYVGIAYDVPLLGANSLSGNDGFGFGKGAPKLRVNTGFNFGRFGLNFFYAYLKFNDKIDSNLFGISLVSRWK